MENLLTPDKGLMIWTVVTFLLLVVVLRKVAWGPLISALKDREDSIRGAIDKAETSRKQAEELRLRFEQDLARGQEKVDAMLSQAEKESQKIRDRILKEAEDEARRLSALNQRQLEEDKAKILRDIRKDVARLSILAAEKIVRSSMTEKVQDQLLQEFFQDLDKQKPKELH